MWMAPKAISRPNEQVFNKKFHLLQPMLLNYEAEQQINAVARVMGKSDKQGIIFFFK